MNQFKTTAELKGIAKVHMFGRYRSAIGAYVLMNLILISITLLIRNVMPTSAAFSVLSAVFTLLISIPVEGILRSGFCFMFLNIACERPVVSSYLFYGFTHDTSKAVCLQSIIAALQIVSLVPASVGIVLYQRLGNPILILIAGILVVVSIVAYAYVSLVYIPVFYLLHDFPEYTVDQILKKSRELMKGSMLRALYLAVSFIPISLLMILSLGVGALWVEPYKEATYTEFFLDLIKNKN